MSTTAFANLRIAWDARVLRPRPWTTAQSRWAAEVAARCPPGPILELCCGAGQIGLLAAVLTRRPLVQVDQDPVATAYARHNAATAGLEVDVRTAPLEEALVHDEVFPVVLVDPPWLPSARVSEFPEDPPTAVDGGPRGTDLIDRGLEVALHHLAGDGRILLQTGSAAQAEHVASVLERLPAQVLEVRAYPPGGVLVLVGPGARW